MISAMFSEGPASSITPAAAARAASILSLFLLLGGCGPASVEEGAYQESMEAEWQMRESIRQTLSGGREEDAAITMVREHKVPEADVSVAEWVQRVLDAVDGDVMFPRWQAYRRAVGRYEVWFSYTVLAGDGTVDKRGLAWVVDLNLQLVEGPRDLTPRELGHDMSGQHRSPKSDAPPAVELIQD